MKKFVFILIFTLFALHLLAQNCTLTIRGTAIDEHTGKPITFANILLEETQVGTMTDDKGAFILENLCEGEYHLSISHIGCETQRVFFYLQSDTTLQFVMDHHSHHLESVVITGEQQAISHQAVQSIKSQAIESQTEQGLANILENITGVAMLESGSGIAKPVVHGLYGNRLTILNNGIPQSGQQWGNDHSPEIDPLVAQRISVVKGVGTLEHLGSSLGSVIIVAPEKIKNEPHLHGKATYFLSSNDWGHSSNLQLQQYNDFLPYKISATFKRSGDNKAPDYYLRNTGAQEINFALQFEKSFSEKWQNEWYISSFNANLGVLRGSHIGNLTDLKEALQRDIPFYTENQFQYAIDAPKQAVNHHLVKWNSSYFLNDKSWLDFTYGGQLNLRKEFDIRRGNRTKRPAMSLHQLSHFVSAKYQQEWAKGWHLKTGVQFQLIDNTNIPETGILPLIPDYYSYQTGLFGMVNKKWDKWLLEWGGRYDFVLQKVVAISRTFPRTIIRNDHIAHQVNALVGTKYDLQDHTQLSLHVGWASRAPAINERYSFGLHQGVSGIEEGNINLNEEKSIKATLGYSTRIGEKLFIESLAYFQSIEDYIYLQPQRKYRLTIRGAFPVFSYKQTDARILGCDVNSTLHLTQKSYLNVKYSFIKGHNVSEKLPLINMPSNQLELNFKHQVAKLSKLENVELELLQKYVFQQKHLQEEQDFVATPKGYYLLGIQVSAEQALQKTRLNYYFKIQNLLNQKYRNYLNRHRYFADDVGINVVLGVSVRF